MRAQGTAFASDYDGTLCMSNWETGEERFEPATLDAVRRYQSAGGLFGVCTGRALFGVNRSVEGKLNLDFYIVTTGAQVLGRNKEPLFERTLEREVAQKIYDLYARDGMAFLAVTESCYYSIGAPYPIAEYTVSSLDEVPGKLLGVSMEFHGDEDAARLARDDMNVRFAGVAEGFQNLGSVDVVPAGCSKGSGIEVLHERLGIECVVGIGDSYNDIPLLQAADVSYTFRTSPQEVRNAATYVVRDLAEAIDHFMCT